jgi:fructan beta-fructosidase
MPKSILFLLALVVCACNSTTKIGNEPHRPKYHYTPPKNWVNDPNGLVFLDGEYHLFYQYNPFGDKWGHMSWGHAVSTDLKTWQTLPVALPEFANANGDTTMIFSGCTVVDSLNTSGLFEKGFKNGLIAIFTSHIEKKAQHQSLAYSSDKGRTWQYYSKNPVLDIGLKDFRDPNVFWYAPKNKWIMTVVKPLDYTVQFYESANLTDWKLLSEFGKTGEMTRIWECPSLFKVPIENSNESKWVVMVSSGHRQKNYLAVQYFVGDFDGVQFIAQKQQEILYVDEGKDFYAAVPFYNLPNSNPKPIVMGWLNDWEYATAIPSTGYRGGFSVPRELSLYLTNGTYKLKQEPIIADNILTETIALKANEALSSKSINSSNGSYRLNLTVNVLDTKGFDLNILKNDTEKSILSYDTATQTLSFDRTQSGDVSFHKRFSSIESMVVKPENNQLKLTILVDKSVVEIYANGGKKVLTDLVFPKKQNGQIDIVWR